MIDRQQTRSFSTTGALEGAWEIATGKLVSLSEQQFVDCDKRDSGCSGGLMDTAFAFAEKNAICTESSYSYKGRGGTCKASSCTVGIPKGGVTGFKDVDKDDEQALMDAVSKQPVSIAVEADKSAFQLYHGGVLTSTCGTNLDHGVLAVGYGTDGGNDYWKVHVGPRSLRFHGVGVDPLLAFQRVASCCHSTRKQVCNGLYLDTTLHVLCRAALRGSCGS